MTSEVKANRIFEKWCVEYVDMDKKRDSIRNNFDQLFDTLCSAAIPWEEARAIAEVAIKHHFPTPSTAKYIYNTKKQFTTLSFKEWVASWENDIKNKGLASFYEFFPDEDSDIKKPSAKKAKSKANTLEGIKTDDDLNEEDFYKSSKIVSRDSPLLFGNGDDK